MRVKRFIANLMVLFSCLCLVSCGKKSEDAGKTPAAEKQEPTVSVDINRTQTRYAGDKLSSIVLYFVGDHTDGTLAWEDEDYVLVLNDNSCKWVFTPTDTSKYKTKTGTLTINAHEALIAPIVNDVELDFVRKVDGVTIDKVYADAKLSTVGLKCVTNVPTGEYTIDWIYPDKTFMSGVSRYEWVFTPSEESGFAQTRGTIQVDTSNLPAQTLSRVELVSNLSGYKAFDTIECDIEVRKVYNAGKSENVMITKSDYTVRYNTGDCLHQGDTSFSITYAGQVADFAIAKVGYFIIPKPTQQNELIYNNTSQELQVNVGGNGAYYSVTQRLEEDAGEYDVTLTINDTYLSECRWAEDETSPTTTVKCEIKKAELQVTETNFNGSYDAGKHSAEVTGTGVEKVYYYFGTGLSELNETNLTTAGVSEEPIEFTSSGTYTVYYFAKGDKNHNNKSGTLEVKINPITPTMTVENCYSLYTGSAVNYPTSYATVIGGDGEPVQTSNFQIEYFYDAGLTMPLGLAPTSVRDDGYYVKVTYKGDGQNLGSVSAVTTLFIDNVNNGLYAQVNESKFAFNGEIYTSDVLAGYSHTGSNKECTKYLEFEVLPASDGIVGLKFSLKLAAGNENVKKGKLIYDNGYVLVCDDGTRYILDLAVDKNSVTINEDTVLQKWVIPDYVATYTAQTVSDEDYNAEKNNGTKNTEIEIYNDYGTIRFIARFNVKYIDTSENFGGVGSANGGYSEAQGVAKCGTQAYGGRFSYSLNCYVTGSDEGYSESSSNYFTMVWLINGDGSVELVDNGYLVTSKLNDVITMQSGGTTVNVSYTKKA